MKFGKVLAPVAASIIMGASLSAFAAGDMDRKAKEILDAMRENPPQIDSSFDGPSGMRGYILRGGVDEPRILIWQTSDGNHLFMGNLYDHTGRDLTDIAGRHYNAMNPVTVAVSMAMDIEGSLMKYAKEIIRENVEADRGTPSLSQGEEPHYYVIEDPADAIKTTLSLSRDRYFNLIDHDNPSHEVFIFADAQCSFCHALIDDLLGNKLSNAETRVSIVPVSVLGQSAPLGAKSLVSDTATATQLMMGVDTDGEASAESLEKVSLNTAILEEHMVLATPAFVIKSADQEGAYIGLTSADLMSILKAQGAPL